ncbi:hypothetical protein MP228_003077 [Amoeboaphelidium protococcarum]|nr:hypothetical protein MP228_003077 [Amoeboaphelidium protococcarum]
MPFLRKLGMAKPVTEYGVTMFQTLEAQKQQSAVGQETGLQKQPVVATNLPASIQSAPASAYKIHIPDGANILSYLPREQEMATATWYLRVMLRKLPSVLEPPNIEANYASVTNLGEEQELLLRDFERMFGSLDERNAPSFRVIYTIVSAVLSMLNVPRYTQEIGRYCCIFGAIFEWYEAVDMVGRLFAATGALNQVQLAQNCDILAKLLAIRMPQQSVISLLPTWSAICYAKDPRAAFYAISVTHALTELPHCTLDDLSRLAATKPGNLLSPEQLCGDDYIEAYNLCSQAEFESASYSMELIPQLERKFAQYFQMDKLREALPAPTMARPSTPVDLSKCKQCGGEKIADCIECNEAFCNDHIELHQSHVTTLSLGAKSSPTSSEIRELAEMDE